jgi:energy-coupling factor transport system ATP-binding protein
MLTEHHLLTSLPPFQGGVVPVPNQIHPISSSESLLVEAQDVAYTYLEGTPFTRQALRGASLSIEKGSCCGLAGGTGSGKTTLLQHLNGLNRPQQGSVRVGPYHLEHRRVSIRSVAQMVGMAFQVPDYQLFAQYAGDEIAYGARQVGKNSQLAERVKRAMQQVGLDFETYKARLTFSLSGGEKRRVALASALVMEPALLLLDEPLSGLDPASRSEMIQRFESWITGGMTIAFSSHSMEDHAALARRMVVLKNGVDFLSGAPQAIFEQVEALHSAMLEPPLATRVAARLRSLGWQIPPGVITPEALLESLAHNQRGAQ